MVDRTCRFNSTLSQPGDGGYRDKDGDIWLTGRVDLTVHDHNQVTEDIEIKTVIYG